MKTTIEDPKMFVCKDHQGKWTAKSSFDMPNKRVLEIETYKNDRGVIRTTATVSTVGDGFKTYRLGRDYYTVLNQTSRMGTAKNVEAQQKAALDDIKDTMSWALAHYAAEDASTAR